MNLSYLPIVMQLIIIILSVLPINTSVAWGGIEDLCEGVNLWIIGQDDWCHYGMAFPPLYYRLAIFPPPSYGIILGSCYTGL